MKLKKFAKKIKKKIVLAEPTSTVSKWLIVNLYVFALVLFTNYARRKASILNIIYEYQCDCLNNRKKTKKLYREILYCGFLYGISAKEYFVYSFKLLSHEGRKTFVTRSNKYKYYKKFNSPNYVDFLNKKTETYRLFKKFYGRDVICLYDEEDFDSFVGFVNKHRQFIYKPAEEYGGHGVEIFNADDYESFRDLFEVIIINGGCVLEELIIQGQTIAQFHPQSVNTVRIVTYLPDDGNPIIQWCFLRIGEGDSHTDNMSSGGIAAMIDPETGVIYSSGRGWDGSLHIYHPDTMVKLAGFEMPEWDSVKAIIKELANTLPEVRFVGWDLAYTEKGWVFVEGNARPQCVAPQIPEFNGKLYKYVEADEIFEADNLSKEIER